MKVETYECQETITEPLEMAEEAIKLIEDLELEGQKSLITKVDDMETKTRCPYRKMKASEQFVFRTLCPTVTDAKKYSASPIPLRVLQIMSHALSLDLFKRVVVWSADGDVKDPVLVAYDNENTWDNDNPYILARWADELDSWKILVNKALAIWKEKTIKNLNKIKAKIESDIQDIKEDNIDIDELARKDTPYYNSW